jgi:hypothetical protein
MHMAPHDQVEFVKVIFYVSFLTEVRIAEIYWLTPLGTEVYFCHQNQNAKNLGNFTTLLKHHNIGTHLKGIETSFQVVPLFFKSFNFWVSCITFWNFLKIPLNALIAFSGIFNIL